MVSSPACARRWRPTAGPTRASRPSPRWTPDDPQRHRSVGGAVSDDGTIPTGPVILTSRFAVPDGYTYDGYVRTGGYTALRKALTEMTAADLAAQVKDATLLGRGGAG